jgi:hypothetical protein
LDLGIEACNVVVGEPSIGDASGKWQDGISALQALRVRDQADVYTVYTSHAGAKERGVIRKPPTIMEWFEVRELAGYK